MRWFRKRKPELPPSVPILPRIERKEEPVEILPLRNAEALETPVMRDLFTRAFRKPKYVEVDAALAEVHRFVTNGDKHSEALVALAGRGLIGLALLSAHTTTFSPYPWVVHFYAERGAKRPLGRACVDWMRGWGYDRVRAINLTGQSDEAWMRAFRGVAPVSKIGGLMEFDLE